jgi:hypothetical protein
MNHCTRSAFNGEASEFSWADDDDSIVVRPADAIAVYTNPHGDLVIRQQNLTDEDSVVIVPKDYVNAIVEALTREVNLRSMPDITR